MCVFVCVFFFLLVFPFQFCRYYGCAGSLLISQRTEMPSALFFFFFSLWPEGSVSGHVEHRRLV